MLGLEWTTLLAATLSIFCGSYIKGAIGFGLPVIVTPIMIFFLQLPDIITLQLFPICISNIQQCWLTRHHAHLLKKIWPMIVINVFILLLGGQILVKSNSLRLMPIIGGLIVLQALLSEMNYFVLKDNKNFKIWMILSGITSGILGSISSFFAFPSVQLIFSLQLKREEFVFLVGFLLSTGFIALWTGIALNGFDIQEKLPLSILLIGPTLIGIWLGNVTRKAFSPKWFKIGVRVMLVLTGLTLIIKSLVN